MSDSDTVLYTRPPVPRPYYAATASGSADSDVHKKLMLEWYGLTPVRGSAWYSWADCPCRLVSKRCGNECSPWTVRDGYSGIWDHARAWRNADGELVITMEPWGSPYDAAYVFARLAKELRELGIVTCFEGRSPYGASYILFAFNENTEAGMRAIVCSKPYYALPNL